LLEIMDVKSTDTTLDERLKNHADYPSMLALKDLLSSYGIASAAIRKGPYSYADLETPFVCHVQQEDWSSPAFTVVTMADERTVEFLHPIKNKKTSVPVDVFEKMDKEVVLLLDGDGKRPEEHYAENRRKERRDGALRQLPAYLFALVWMAAFAFLWNMPGEGKWLSMAFLLSSGLGLLFSGLLVVHDINAHNPLVRQVCGAFGKKSNCDAVLSS